MVKMLKKGTGVNEGYNLILMVLERVKDSKRHFSFEQIIVTSGYDYFDILKCTTVTDILNDGRWVYFGEMLADNDEPVEFYGESVTKDGFECIAIAISNRGKENTLDFAEKIIPEQKETFENAKDVIRFGNLKGVTKEEYLSYQKKKLYNTYY